MGNNTTVKNYITEFLQNPSQWRLDDERYDWLSDRDKEYLTTQFDFDYGDILDCENHFNTIEQTCDRLMCTEKDLDSYCQKLWNKPFSMIHKALYIAAKDGAVDDVFMPFARQGNATAMTILTHHIMKLDKEERNNALTIKIVNDLGDEE